MLDAVPDLISFEHMGFAKMYVIACICMIAPEQSCPWTPSGLQNQSSTMSRLYRNLLHLEWSAYTILRAQKYQEIFGEPHPSKRARKDESPNTAKPPSTAAAAVTPSSCKALRKKAAGRKGRSAS